MKKILMILAVVAVAVFTSVSCKKTDPQGDEVARVKAAAMGDWTGTLSILAGGGEVTVTFTETKITTTGDLTVNITRWYAIDKDVYVKLDDEMKTDMKIEVNGAQMNLAGNSTFFLMNFPSTLAKRVL